FFVVLSFSVFVVLSFSVFDGRDSAPLVGEESFVGETRPVAGVAVKCLARRGDEVGGTADGRMDSQRKHIEGDRKGSNFTRELPRDSLTYRQTTTLQEISVSQPFPHLSFEFLEKQRPNYAVALKNGSKDDFLKDVVRRFFKRFPVELAMDVEPTEDQLNAVDDAKPDQEIPIPNAKEMSPEEFQVALKTYEEHKEIITRRTGQIVRWFTYRHEKELGITKEVDLDDPITILTCRLTGASSFKPRKPVASNLWAKLNKERIDEAFAKRSSASKTGRVDINMRQEVARALFKELPNVDRSFWNLRAEQDHRRQLQEWEETVKRPASTDPEARQHCIDGITAFMQPILDLVFEFTGMPTTFMMGGPEPADKGRLNII
ncbi:hypothetical protein GALMADRAFT_1350442, partial [Galerina marginata CBS 339.88]